MERSQKVVLSVLGVVGITAALLVGWWLGSAGSSSAEAQGSAVNISVDEPVIVTADELHEVAQSHYPLYWAGERPDTSIELTLTSAGGAFVRYLPPDAKAGASQEYLTVGTYYAVDGYSSLAAVDPDTAHVVTAQNGAVIVTFDSDPLSTYFSFPRASFQVEVFSPTTAESKTLTDDGTITIVGGTR